MDKNLAFAAQQLTGFCHGRDGYSVGSLCEAMGMDKEEWEKLKKQGYIDWMDEQYRKEIEEHFATI